MHQILIRATFTGWREITKQAAIDHTRWKMGAMTMGRNDAERLAIINSRLRGIKFTLDELK